MEYPTVNVHRNVTHANIISAVLYYTHTPNKLCYNLLHFTEALLECNLDLEQGSTLL